MRIGAVLALIVALVALAGCGQSATNSPSPQPTSTPTAVSYANVQDLVAAIRAAGQPELSDVHIGAFPERLVPAGAHAQRGAFGVAVPGEDAPWFTVAGAFPDAGTMRYGVSYGQYMAAVGFHATAIWQLRGPDWFLWGIGKTALQAVQGAIGGELGPTLHATPSPKATS